MDLREEILRAAIQNALRYGKAKPGPVVGKVMAAHPELRDRAREVWSLVEEVVREVNSMGRDELLHLAEEIGALETKKEEREERRWPPLPEADRFDVIVTRVAPEPNGYPHFGHVKGLIVPFVYARMYGGRFLLRFEDTNPRVERIEYYEAIREEFAEVLEAAERELGLSPGRWDEEIIESNHLEELYEKARQLILQGDAYVCTCPAKVVRVKRARGEPCEHRDQSPEINLELWERMLSGGFSEGEAHLRLRTDMRHPNLTMRDPGIFRIIEHPHPIHGDRYRVYPTYDFAVSVMDSLTGVTHAFRSKEFEPHVEVQKTILRRLGLRDVVMIQFGRLTVEGLPLSKRYIRPLIESGVLEGWDDPRIPTLRGLKRRGITYEALVRFLFDMGPSKVDAAVSMDALAAYNRKYLDPITPRYMFVPDPVTLEVYGAPPRLVAELPVHPSRREMGVRRIEINAPGGVFKVYVPYSDVRAAEPGDRIRLRGLANVRIRSVMPDAATAVYEPEKDLSVRIVQWAPAGSSVPCVAIVPETPYSYRVVGGYGEPAMSELKEGEMVHLVRFGFARVDSSSGGSIRLIVPHS